jgi:dTDP-glucose pyrophosphorylase
VVALKLDWQSAVIKDSESISDAIAQLDRSALQILMATDSEGLLEGTLTDGDLRRAILGGVDLKHPISEIINRSPFTARPDWSNARMLALMDEKRLLQLPVVDDNRRIVDLVTLQGLLSRPKQTNKVFLMAGGFGTRLRPLTESCPKPMLKVGTKPILEQIIGLFVDSGYYQFFISTHFMPEVISDYFGDGSRLGASIRYIHEEIPLGTAGALSLLPRDEFQEPFFVMNGDILTDLDPVSLMATHERLSSRMTVCLRDYETQIPFGVVNTKDEYISGIEEKPIQRFSVSAGIYVISPPVLDDLSPGSKLDMPDLIEQQTAVPGSVGVYNLNGTWLDIGRLDDFELAQSVIKEI